jgi:hypothetical protein
VQELHKIGEKSWISSFAQSAVVEESGLSMMSWKTVGLPINVGPETELVTFWRNGHMERQGTYIQIRLPKWMKDRFFAITKRGERSNLIRKRIMEVIRTREKERS